MIWRIRIGHWRFTFTFAPVSTVIGVNSNLPDGNHILMWDFDESDLGTIEWELQRVQRTYKLPTIYILETKKGTNYIAYCFKRTHWCRTVEIITYTKFVDWGFIKFGVFRGHFTLRVTPKHGRKIHLIDKIKSTVEEDCTLYDLKSWVEYETLQDKYPVTAKVIEVKGFL